MDLRQAKVGLTDVTDLNLRSIMRLYPYGSKKNHRDRTSFS